MAATTESRPTVQPTEQPTFWKNYSPRGECPMSFTGSALLHVLVPLAFIAVLWLSGQVGDNENARPPKMDVVEIEGGGGGLGNLGTGTGAGDPGKVNRTELPGKEKLQDQKNDFQDPFKPLKVPHTEPTIIASEDRPVILDADDLFAKISQEQQRANAILEKEFVGSKGAAGAGVGTGGNSGGTKGSGVGSKSGPGQGTDPNGKLISQQRKHELRWQILASPDPDIHLKKLQALKVLLVIPLASKPGRALQYDLSKTGTVKGEEVRFVDNDSKVRWMNKDQKEMMALQNALRLPEVPRYAMIYLPTDLERDMARRELTEFGRQEHQIKMTIWDVRPAEVGFENTPFIVRQILWTDMK